MSQHDDGLAYGEDHSGQQPEQSSGFFSKLTDKFKNLSTEVESDIKKEEQQHIKGSAGVAQHRFGSFVSPKEDNDVKWYVDGCGYFYAVSRALESAQDSIWILDWWLSPELYLRRPPSKNEQYRLDRMLKAAAERGVKISIIVYKEVTQALTRKYLNPTLPDYLHSLLPRSTDPVTSSLVRLGLMATATAMEYLEEESPLMPPPITVSSSHTKHALEDLHPNIAVFRHPDHLPDKRTLLSNLRSSFQNLKLTAHALGKMSGDTIKAVYGMSDDVILYWAHHEKLCLVDGQIAFMGGLDMCFGRWDNNQHSIADAHPGDLNAIMFPGQDYNNARIADFEDVAHWDHNKVDRTQSSRMGWSDISISLHGPCVLDLRRHFIDRWNFIYDEKYDVRTDARYHKFSLDSHVFGQASNPKDTDQPKEHHRHFLDHMRDAREQVEGHEYDIRRRFGHHFGQQAGNMTCQLVRSCTKWSNGTPTEHSIQNAYIDVIQNSQHFVYIENQFFITATDRHQRPVENMIGKAIVDRVLRAARAGEKFKVIVLIPSVPGFAGDLKDESALGTRAIMEFQYHSINRGHGYSIMEQIQKEGYDPKRYIRFYNLRNYDRINVSKTMQQVEKQSGVNYEDARIQHDHQVGAGYAGKDEGRGDPAVDKFQEYQQAAKKLGKSASRWDSVASCYMLNGEDIRNVPWEGSSESEIDAFVSEELYIHSKVLVADDRTVICGSANLNDRSQLGTHDSEIALVIEDPTPVDSVMNGQRWQASRFAASLRRQLFRKHLGLLPPQDPEQPNANFEPIGVPNEYDWGSAEDRIVEDPLSSQFEYLWNERASTNTEVFRRIFHAVPDDTVRTWDDYSKFYEYYFHDADEEADHKDKDQGKKKPARYEWGHVIRENFPPGAEGITQVKDLLSQVKGTLVEMPLNFLDREDIAVSGTSLNPITEPVYT